MAPAPIAVTPARSLLALIGILAVVAAARADVADLVAAVERDRIEAHVRSLEGVRESLQERAAAADAIDAELTSYGYTVVREGFWCGENVVATRPGAATAEPVVVIGAHYDTVPGSPGADDDASGVAALLEIARVVADQPQAASIEFVAFDCEELGLVGSSEHAANLFAAHRSVAGMVSLEMIGFRCEGQCQFPFGNWPGCWVVSTPGVSTGDFIGLVANTASVALLDGFVAGAVAWVPSLRVEWLRVQGDGTCQYTTRRSDHASFWDYGFPAMMLTDTADYRNHDYHQPTDLADTLDFDFATDVTRATLAWAVTLVPEPAPTLAAALALAALAALRRDRATRPRPPSR